MNAEPGCRRLRHARLNCDWRKSRPPTIASMSPVAGSIADQRRLQVGVAEAPQAVLDRALGRILQLRHERRPHLPVGRMVAAEPVAELLPQELLRVADARLGRAGIRRGSAAAPARAAFSCAGVMNPSSRIRCSTTWLRSSAPSKFDHGDSADGARIRPAISAASGSVSRLAGLPNRFCDIVSTP